MGHSIGAVRSRSTLLCHTTGYEIGGGKTGISPERSKEKEMAIRDQQLGVTVGAGSVRVFGMLAALVLAALPPAPTAASCEGMESSTVSAGELSARTGLTTREIVRGLWGLAEHQVLVARAIDAEVFRVWVDWPAIRRFTNATPSGDMRAVREEIPGVPAWHGTAHNADWEERLP
jgi:hypothetical protein